KTAGYSKATLYVYFKNKEEIIAALVMESMKKLYIYIADSLEQYTTTRKRYEHICQGLVNYQKEFPFYFEMALDRIEIQTKNPDSLMEETENWKTGEKINEKLKVFLQEGINAGELRADIEIIPTIFAFWGMLSGLIQIAVKKEAYIKETIGLTQDKFLEYGFEMLYQSITNKKGD
ncbi:MAG: TetR/AcrR family transcriptional regulator, partial [Clostridia bacterium]|nr:TetR/AcrR family transcriptional regulator [Clostridia bacterium]MDY5555269.1 TetR/AcrR family transcriptional regulator [Blautia sp.]